MNLIVLYCVSTPYENWNGVLHKNPHAFASWDATVYQHVKPEAKQPLKQHKATRSISVCSLLKKLHKTTAVSLCLRFIHFEVWTICDSWRIWTLLNGVSLCFVPLHHPVSTENTSNYKRQNTSKMLVYSDLNSCSSPFSLCSRLNHDSLSPASLLCLHPGG